MNWKWHVRYKCIHWDSARIFSTYFGLNAQLQMFTSNFGFSFYKHIWNLEQEMLKMRSNYISMQMNTRFLFTFRFTCFISFHHKFPANFDMESWSGTFPMFYPCHMGICDSDFHLEQHYCTAKTNCFTWNTLLQPLLAWTCKHAAPEIQTKNACYANLNLATLQMSPTKLSSPIKTE